MVHSECVWGYCWSCIYKYEHTFLLEGSSWKFSSSGFPPEGPPGRRTLVTISWGLLSFPVMHLSFHARKCLGRNWQLTIFTSHGKICYSKAWVDGLVNEGFAMQAWELKFDSKLPCKKPEVVAHSHPTVGHRVRSILGTCWPASLAYLAHSIPMRNSASKNKKEGTWGMTPEVELWPVHVNAYTCMHMYTHLCTHTYANKHMYTPTQ